MYTQAYDAKKSRPFHFFPPFSVKKLKKRSGQFRLSTLAKNDIVENRHTHFSFVHISMEDFDIFNLFLQNLPLYRQLYQKDNEKKNYNFFLHVLFVILLSSINIQI